MKIRMFRRSSNTEKNLLSHSA